MCQKRPPFSNFLALKMCSKLDLFYERLKHISLLSTVYSFLYSRASDYGYMKIDETGRIIQFAEKPKGSALKIMVRSSA